MLPGTDAVPEAGGAQQEFTDWTSISAPAATRARHNDDIGIAGGTAAGDSLNGPGVTKDHLFEEYNQAACEGIGRRTAFVPTDSQPLRKLQETRHAVAYGNERKERMFHRVAMR